MGKNYAVLLENMIGNGEIKRFIVEIGWVHKRQLKGDFIGSNITGGSRLSLIFWEHENQSGLLVIRLIYIKLYRKMENNFWKKNLG